MRDSVGGRELSSRGFDSDVAVATDLNSSDVVPAMVGATFTLLAPDD
jgi:phosphosulfolactate phosphohydrolase-like enzyme